MFRNTGRMVLDRHAELHAGDAAVWINLSRRISTTGATARVFTVEEELPFAGHPVLGAAAAVFIASSQVPLSAMHAFLVLLISMVPSECMQ